MYAHAVGVAARDPRPSCARLTPQPRRTPILSIGCTVPPARVALRLGTAGHRWTIAPASALCVLVLAACSGPRGCGGGDEPSRPSVPPNPITFADPSLPGTRTPSEPLTRRLREALDAKGTDYTPRTHHLLPDGAPKYVNRLILETSPYLLQHAHNPVNWYPWGDEAFERIELE